MKTNSLFSLLGLVSLLVWILTLCIPAGLLTAATDEKPDGLTLALSTAKQGYILGEPALVRPHPRQTESQIDISSFNVKRFNNLTQ